MSTNDRAGLETSGTDDRCIDERDARALKQYLTVLPETGRARGADDLYLVVSESGKEYLVDAREGRCTCPDHEYREVRCKHLRRVAFATGARAVPADADSLDDQLGAHVDGGPCVAATDGGTEEIVVAGDGAEILDADSEDQEDVVDLAEKIGDAPAERPAGCYCSGESYETIPCFECWRAGHTEPNPDAEPEDADTEGEER